MAKTATGPTVTRVSPSDPTQSPATTDPNETPTTAAGEPGTHQTADTPATASPESAPERTAGAPSWFWWPLGLTAVLDLVTKYAVFAPAEPRAYWQDVPWLVTSENPGVAWSMFASVPWLVTAVTVVLVPTLIWAYWRWFRRTGTLVDLAFGAILGGALGNAWDRILAWVPGSGIGGVRDFIYIDLNWVGIDYVWPTFNIADVGISVGFIAILLDSFIRKPEPVKQ